MSSRRERRFAALAVVACALGVACGGGAIPSPDATLRQYERAAASGDANALYDLLTESSRRSLGREGVARAVSDARDELREQAIAVASPSAHLESLAKVRFSDGEVATLTLEDGRFRISSADALPAGARTPAQALEQLRRVLARRSYAGLMRVLSKETRNAIEHDLRTLVEGLDRPDALDVKVQGDRATVQTSGGHLVRLKRENGFWVVDDFD